jgi:hypothetical protein
LLVVSSVLTFVLEVPKIVDVEELTVEEWNLICFFILVPQAPILISNSNNWIHFSAKVTATTSDQLYATTWFEAISVSYSFVQTCRTQFALNEQPMYVNGANIY